MLSVNGRFCDLLCIDQQFILILSVKEVIFYVDQIGWISLLLLMGIRKKRCWTGHLTFWTLVIEPADHTRVASRGS